MKLSIIIINYNTGKLTSNCIRSILDQNIKIEYEIIVVDNGSTDTSRKDFESLTNKNNIVFIFNSKNYGFSRGVNIGLTKSSGKYKLLLNSDVIVKNDSINRLLDFAESNLNTGVVGAKLINPDGTVQASVLNFPTIGNAIREYWIGKKSAYSKYIPKSDQPSVVECVVGAVMLITPRAINRVGLFDERYFMYYEDLDYCRRIQRAALKVYYYPDAKFVHFHGKSGPTTFDTKEQWRRLIPSSIIYNGIIKHYLINSIIWFGQKFINE